jgi:hypothetical protein
MTVSVTPVWLHEAVEEDFNRRPILYTYRANFPDDEEW